MAKLQIEVELDQSGAVKGFRTLEGGVDKFDKSTKKATSSMKGMWKQMAVGQLAVQGLNAGFRMMKQFIGDSISLFIEQQRVENQLNKVLKSTGFAAGLTADELKRMASELQKQTIYGDEAIIGAENLLLTFKGIGKDVFPDALKSILDVSRAMDQDLKTSTIQIGKVLNDPIANMGALSRAGIQFSKDQKAVIKSFQETGQLGKAQAIILKELESQFGGSADAIKGDLGDALKQASNLFGDFQEKIGEAISESSLIQDALTDVKEILSDPEFIKSAQEVTKVMIEGFRVAGKAIIWAAGAVKDFIKQLPYIDKITEAYKNLGAILTDQFGKALDKEIDGLKNSALQTKKAMDMLTDFRKEIGMTAAESLKMTKDWSKSGTELDKATWTMHQISTGRYGEKLRDQMIEFRKGARQAEEAQQKVTEEIKKSVPVIQKKVKTDKEEKKEISEKIKALAKEYKTRYNMYEGLQKGLDKMGLAFLQSQKSSESVKKATDDLSKSYTEQVSKLELVKRGFDSLMDVFGIFGVKADGVINDFVNIGKSTFNFIDSLKQPDLFSKVVAGLDLFKNVAVSVANWLKGDGPGKALKRDVLKGIKITEALEKQLRELEKETKDMHLAASLMFEDLVNGSDVTVENFDIFARQLRSMLSDFDRGKLSASELNKEMGEGFDALIAKAKELGTEGSATLLQLFDDLKGRGLEVTAITEYMISQFKSGVQGLAQYAEAGGQNVQQYSQALFDSLQKQGVGLMEIVKIMGSNLPESWAKWSEEHKNLISQIEGSQQMLEAFGNTGSLTGELFGKFQNETNAYYKQLRKSGLSASDSLQMLAPMLAKQLWYSQQQGVELDKKTKKMIENAKKEGINLDALIPKEDKQLAIFEKMSDTLDRIAEAFGVQIPRNMETMNRAIQKTANQGIQKFGQLQNKISGLGGGGIPDIGMPFKKFQHGGSFVTNRPTLMNIGGSNIATSEHHVPERVTIEPLNRRRGSDAPMNISMNVNLNVSSADTQGLTLEQFGKYMNRAIEYGIDGVVEKTAKKLKRYING